MKVKCKLCECKDDKSIMQDHLNSKGNRHGYEHPSCRIEHDTKKRGKEMLFETIRTYHNIEHMPAALVIEIENYTKKTNLTHADINEVYIFCQDTIKNTIETKQDKFFDYSTRGFSKWLEIKYCWGIVKNNVETWREMKNETK